MTLSNNQNVVLDIFIHHVPRIFRAFFRPANAQTFTLTQRVVHQALMLANLFAINGDDFARLSGQVTTEKLAELTFADEADTG